MSSGGYNQQQAVDMGALESMLQQFRVNELQLLLGAFKVPKLGKKTELVDRAKALLYRQRPPNQSVVNKIRDIHMKRYVGMPSGGIAGVSGGTVSPDLGQGNGVSGQLNAAQQVFGAAYQQYQQSAGYLRSSASNRVKDLRVVDLPFYDQLQTVIDFVELPVRNPGKVGQDELLAFSVPENFSGSVSYRSESQPLPRIELQLRFFQLDQSHEHKDEFPPNCTVRLDDQPVQLPNIIPTNKPNAEAKRPSRPVNITPYCQPPRCSNRQHRMQIFWNADKRTWAVTVNIVRRLTSDILLKRLRNNTKMHRLSDYTRRMVRRRLGVGEESDDIAMDHLRVSLLCPLGKVRMKIPTKPAQCEHLQCFDGNLFLMMNEKKPTWKCPVCDNAARYSDLVIDGYFEDMLTTTGKNVTEVELLRDGQWKAVASEEDSDDETGSTAGSVPVSTNPTVSKASTGTQQPKAGESDDDVIVLDSDDDERTNGQAQTSRGGGGGVRTVGAAACSAPQPSCSSAAPDPSPSSPTQSEGSDQSVICIEDPSSSPPSRPNTGHRLDGAYSSSSVLAYLPPTPSYSPATPGYAPLSPAGMVSHSGQSVRRTAGMGGSGGNGPPAYKRLATEDRESPASLASLQLPTVSAIPPHLAYNGFACPDVRNSGSSVNSSFQSNNPYYGQAWSSTAAETWMNSWRTPQGYSTSSMDMFGGTGGQGTSTSGVLNGFEQGGVYGQQSVFGGTALPDFTNRVNQELQNFLSTIGAPHLHNSAGSFNS